MTLHDFAVLDGYYDKVVTINKLNMNIEDIKKFMSYPGEIIQYPIETLPINLLDN